MVKNYMKLLVFMAGFITISSCLDGGVRSNEENSSDNSYGIGTAFRSRAAYIY
jgi:hypothetical protein